MDSPKNTFQNRVMGIPEPKICYWKFEDDNSVHDTACGYRHCFPEDNIKVNKYKYCPFCGGIIVEAKSNE